MPRVVAVREVPGVEAALATRDPARCAREVGGILAAGADRKEVVRTAALASAHHFAPAMPPPSALVALGASLDLAAVSPGAGPIVQACALAASEWGKAPEPAAASAIVGDELHLARSFLGAVRSGDAAEAGAIFAGLLREGDERRLAGDALFEACAQDLAGNGAKLGFAVGSWRLARALGWARGPALMRPAVGVAAMAPQDLGDHGAILREVGRARLDLELAARNVAPIDATARNTYGIALAAGPDRLVADLIAGLKRGRAPAGYADLIAATAAERLAGTPDAMDAALFALAVRFVVGFSRTSTHTLAVLQAARAVAKVRAPEALAPLRVGVPDVGLADMDRAIEARNPREASRLVLGLLDAVEPEVIVPRLVSHAVRADATADRGQRLVYGARATELAEIAPAPALVSLAAVLARAPANA